MTREECLRELIYARGFKSLAVFAKHAGVNYNTFDSGMRRGIDGMGVQHVIKICDALGISVEFLYNDYEDCNGKWTPDEIFEIESFKRYLKSKRRRDEDKESERFRNVCETEGRKVRMEKAE